MFSLYELVLLVSSFVSDICIHLSQVNDIHTDLLFSSRECQMSHWSAGHKKKCKKEKVAYDKYCREKETNSPDPHRFMVDGGSLPMIKYKPGNLRFNVGDRVECQLMGGVYGTGRIVKLYYTQPGLSDTAPYQIKLDRETADRQGVPAQHALIYSIWDDDIQIRKLPEKQSKGCKKTSYQVVD